MESHQEGRTRVYDCRFLLSPEKRNQVMELWEVEKYGADSFSDSGYVRIYGMSPVEWYGRQIQVPYHAPSGHAQVNPDRVQSSDNSVRMPHLRMFSSRKANTSASQIFTPR